jgi:hypothetical protein
MIGRTRILSVTIDDCELQTFRAGGKGGQNQNKRDTGVRIIHRASGGRGEARDERSQLQNKKLAWRRLADDPRFKLWLRIQLGQQLASESAMPDIPESDLKVEVRKDGRWVSESPLAS